MLRKFTRGTSKIRGRDVFLEKVTLEPNLEDEGNHQRERSILEQVGAASQMAETRENWHS